MQMLAAAIYAIKWFLMQDALKTIFFSDTFQCNHHQLLMIRCYVALFKDRNDLELPGCHFVVSCLDRYTQTVELPFGFEHVGEYTVGYGAEAVVGQLLAPRWFCTHESSVSRHQVGPSVKALLIKIGRAARREAVDVR